MAYSPLDPIFEEQLDKVLPNQLDKQISQLLARLQASWVCDRTDNEYEGYMYKRQRKAPHRWVLYRFVLSGNNLYYFSNATAKKPRGIIQVCYLSHRVPTTESQLLEIQNPDVSKTHFMIFSPNRLDMFAATSNEDVLKWHQAIEKVTRENLKKEDVIIREKALLDLLPLLNQKSSQDLLRILTIVAELEQSGFSKSRNKKEKMGNLDMLMEEDFGEMRWMKHYFVLQSQCLQYFKSSKLPPKGIITLKFTQIKVGGAADPENSFRLITPLSTFTLRAKHLIALQEWVTALEASKEGRKLVATPVLGSSISKGLERSGLLMSSTDDDFDGIIMGDEGANMQFFKKFIPQLTYKMADGRSKTFKLPPGFTTIGRSESCSLTLDDKLVSRAHCKIDVSESSAVLLDLGSGHGTKVDGAKIDRHVLKPGQVIKVGHIKMKFDVVKK